MAWVVRDGAAKASSQSAQELIKEFGHCVYTTLRTFGGLPVSLNVHYQRLVNSSREIGIQEPSEEQIVSAVKAAANTLGEGKEAVVTIATNGEHIITHVKELPPFPAPPVKVGVVPTTRKYGEVKDSSWIAERESLPWPPGANELLLMTADGSILEGASSNFFVVKQGILQTATDHILSGSIRRLVLRAAEAESIPVDLTPPNWNDRSLWQDAFITSTSRLVLPIDHLIEKDIVALSFPERSSIVSRLRQAVEQQLSQESTLDIRPLTSPSLD